MLILLSGVSGSGKDTIKKELIKRVENVESLPSYTDRKPRENGVVYNFVTTQEFEEMIRNDEFYEYNIHHEHYYGTSRKLMNEKISSGKIIVKDMDVNGTDNLLKILSKDERIRKITPYAEANKASSYLAFTKKEMHLKGNGYFAAISLFISFIRFKSAFVAVPRYLACK